MDAIDRKILAILQYDGRITLTDLAEQVQLSVSRCQRRFRDLEQRGVILGYHANIEPKRAGFDFEVVGFVTLTSPAAISEFDPAIAAIPEIVEAQRLFGIPDYVLRIITVDRESYQKLYDDRLSQLPGLRSLRSTIVMKQTVQPRGLPLS